MVAGAGWKSRVRVGCRGCGSKVAGAGFDVAGGKTDDFA